MQTERPYVLSVAGFDPCGGAGLTADIKTFEQLKVYGLSVCTGLTQQTEDEFLSVTWREEGDVLKEIEMLLNKYPVKAVKTGIFPSFSFLRKVVAHIHQINPEIKIVVDPIHSSSTGFVINDFSEGEEMNFLDKITLITPNMDEMEKMAGENKSPEFLSEMIKHTSVLLKGGHSKSEKGKDILYQQNETAEILPSDLKVYPKHGSGCVLSAAIVANLALRNSLKDSCIAAKRYTEKFLAGNKHLLGYHNA